MNGTDVSLWDASYKTPPTDEMLEELWMETWSGGRIYPFRKDPGKFVIEDIAHALSMACRFAGHIPIHYSVAQHSVLVALGVGVVTPYASKELRLSGLLHDATEAFLGDLPAPAKLGLLDYQRVEENLERAIAMQFGAIYPWPEEVMISDMRMLLTEGIAFGKKVEDWGLPEWVTPLDFEVVPWEHRNAEAAFLSMARELCV